MLQLAGILIVLNSLVVSAWWLGQGKSWGVGLTTVAVLACLVGLALIFNERAIELSFGQFGSIKTAAKQAETDAKEVAEIRKRVEAQAATMDLVAKESAEAKELLNQLTEQNKIAEQKIEAINKLAAPPTLSIQTVDLTKPDGTFQAVITFISSKNMPLGALQFVAAIKEDSGAKILEFWPTLDGGAYQSGDDSKQIEKDGKKATLIYQLMGAGKPSVKLVTSQPTKVIIAGNYIKDSYQIELK